MSSEVRSEGLKYLTRNEGTFLDAAVEILIPADELGPGGREAGVTDFIDGQLASTWGSHGRNYRSGPWPKGSPEQGYQSPLTPQELYRQAIREIDDFCRNVHGKPFAQLSAVVRTQLLVEMEADQIPLASVSSKLFFDLLWRNTEEGFFSDPMYGGNRNKVGWKLLGFPGIPSGEYVNRLDKSEPYLAEPVSIVDYERGSTRIDAEGFAKHIIIKRSEDSQ